MGQCRSRSKMVIDFKGTRERKPADISVDQRKMYYEEKRIFYTAVFIFENGEQIDEPFTPLDGLLTIYWIFLPVSSNCAMQNDNSLCMGLIYMYAFLPLF